MKKFNTLLCCICMTLYGAFINTTGPIGTQTVTAAPATNYYSRIPYDLNPVRTIRELVHDTVEVSTRDTIIVPKVVTKYKVKEVKVPYRDTIDVAIHLVFDNCSSHHKKESVEPDSLPHK